VSGGSFSLTCITCYLYDRLDRAHEKCGEVAPKDCGLRPYRPGIHQHQALASPLQAMSPLSKVKRDTVGEGAFKAKSQGVGLGINIKR